MTPIKPLRLLGAAALLSASALAATAQQTSPPTSPSTPPAEKPPMTKPDAAPAPQTAPTPAPQMPRASTKTDKHPMIGLVALSSDGNKAGDIRAVKTSPDGKVTAIQLKVGGFLGFGGKIVEVSEGKFTRKGDTVQLGYTSDELSNLPEVKDAT